MEKSRIGLNIVDIPRGILCDILLKLPVWTIKQCGCVCKTFRDIVSDSEFKQLYSSRVCLVFHGRNHLWCIDSCALTDNANANANGNGWWLPPLTDKSRFITLKMPILMDLVNSSNGLVCLRCKYRSQPHYYIFNPLLGEVLRVPPAPTVDCWSSAFGFDPKSKQCKILQMVFKPHMNIEVAELYQSGDDKWMVIETAPPSPPPATWRFAFDPSLNGALHWLPREFGVYKFISSFDLHTNEFKLLPSPSHFHFNPGFKMSSISLGVLKGCLCLCYVTKDNKFETWLMEKYGVQESWTKVFTIHINSYRHRGLRLDYDSPIGFSNSGDMWVRTVSRPCSLVTYSAEADVFRQIDTGVRRLPTFEATPHVFSFVSLKDMVNLRDTHLRIEKLPPN